jgi:hypothetical protein
MDVDMGMGNGLEYGCKQGHERGRTVFSRQIFIYQILGIFNVELVQYQNKLECQYFVYYNIGKKSFVKTWIIIPRVGCQISSIYFSVLLFT